MMVSQVSDRTDPNFTIAREMARLRHENDCLKAELAELKAEKRGHAFRQPLSEFGIVGQAAKVLACLIKNRGVFVGGEDLCAAGGIDGLTADNHLRVVVTKLRRRLHAIMIAADFIPVGDVIEGRYGAGYRLSRSAGDWLMARISIHGAEDAP